VNDEIMSQSSFDLFVPGRLCLFGEHSDWAGRHRLTDPSIEPGRCLIAGTDQGLFAGAERIGDFFELKQVSPAGLECPPNAYRAEYPVLEGVALSHSFDSYAAGTAALMVREHGVGGLRLDVFRRSLPLGKGLSSSAAVCVLTARAYNLAYGLGLSVEEEMDLAYRGEVMTGSECGRMDQACALGRGRPVLLTFDGDGFCFEGLNPGGEFHYLIVDLKGKKDTRRILRDLNEAFLRGERGLRDALGPVNREILEGACRAFSGGDARALGALMKTAQEVFDEHVAPCCPGELSSPGLHAVLGHPALRELAWGAKGVGSQGDGAAQILCRGLEERTVLAGMLKKDVDVGLLELSIASGS
jgi:mevalonate kinase